MPTVYDRVKETTVTTGTGAVSLAGALAGFRAFGDVLDDQGDTYYVIAGGTEWEVGIGHYNSGGNTLSRDVVLSSSNSNALVSFSAGTKSVWIDHPAQIDMKDVGLKIAIQQTIWGV